MTQLETRNVLLSSASRYKDSTLRIVDGRRFYGLWQSDPALLERAGGRRYQVRQIDVGRLDRISFETYGTPIYWWIIADANGIVDPFRDMRPGSFIRLPDFSVVQRYVQRVGRST